jgi:S1-C subfamily serine protease
LLKADAGEIAVADWSNAPSPEVGTFITAAAPAGQDPLAIGVVSVAVRSIQEKGRGFLGVQVDGDGKGILIGTVFENGAAAAAGVKRGDRVLELDGEKPASDLSFRTTLSSKHAGDKIRLKIQRGAETIEKEVVLGDRANSPIRLGGRGDKMNSMGSTLSKRSNEFPSVIQTDFPLDASKCGGPVTDLDGNVIGMVIARSGRIETLVLPSQVIVSVLKDVDFSK